MSERVEFVASLLDLLTFCTTVNPPATEQRNRTGKMKSSMLTKSAFNRAAIQKGGKPAVLRAETISPLDVNASKRIVGVLRWAIADTGILRQPPPPRRMYHFASSRFSEAIGRLPAFDSTLLRKESVRILSTPCSHTRSSIGCFMLCIVLVRVRAVSYVSTSIKIQPRPAVAASFLGHP